MSADMQKPVVSLSTPAVVSPQPVTNRSIIDSVAGFINDVASTNTSQGESKNQIVWMQFEEAADVSDISLGDGVNRDTASTPLLLILGYVNGIQVWALPSNGEAVEVLSWKHGSFKCLRVLPTPISNSELDLFQYKRPLVALTGSLPSNPTACSKNVNYFSLKDGDQVKADKFPFPVVDILANRTIVAVIHPDAIAVFDSKTLEERFTIYTCAPSPGVNPNPVALGTRWLAFRDKKLQPSKRSGGGFEGEEATSYKATVLNAAKTLGKGLRGLGGQVAAGLTGNAQPTPSVSNATSDVTDQGVVSILDIKIQVMKNKGKENSPTTNIPVSVNGVDPIVAHFLAHHEPIVAMKFDFSGTLLVTADRRGHDFNLFRIHPHPGGPSLAAVHHLYVLHRGDTTSKVQDISFSLDSRWVSVSTMRGTSHVFGMTPYGGQISVRTHCSSHVVNRLSRFHRSAGLTADGRSSSPVNFTESSIAQQLSAYSNPRTPPYPHPTTICALAQIRHPFTLSSSQLQTTKSSLGRQKTLSGSEDVNRVVRVASIFAKERSWLLDPPSTVRETPNNYRGSRKTVDSLFIMTGHGALIQYDLDPKPTSTVPKEKICDETPLELAVEARAQWVLEKSDTAFDIQPPLQSDNILLNDIFINKYNNHEDNYSNHGRNEKWLSQVEIVTHAGPHRRLWMGPQFTFKTYNTPSGSSLSELESEAVEIGINQSNRGTRSHPVNMPAMSDSRNSGPITMECGSYNSHDQSPRTSESYRIESHEDDYFPYPVESRLKDDIADAMRESPSTNLTGAGDSSSNSSCYGSTQNLASSANKASTIIPSIINIVNPLGTVTTHDAEKDVVLLREDEDEIHENCDESLFRPFVTVISEDATEEHEKMNLTKTDSQLSSLKLVLPVIEKRVEKCSKQVESLTVTTDDTHEIAMEIVTKSPAESLESSICVSPMPKLLETIGNADIADEKVDDEPPQFFTNSYIDGNEEVENLQLNMESLLLAPALNIDTVLFPPLEPIEPLDDFLDSLEKIDVQNSCTDQNLIKLESPSETEQVSKDSPLSLSQINDGNIIFAMCTSLKEDKKDIMDVQEGQDSDYKSLETEDCSNIDSVNNLNNDNTSSDDNTESSTICLHRLDDEELTPLIKGNKFFDLDSNNEGQCATSSDNNINFKLPLTPTHNGNGKKRSRRKRK